MAKFQLVGRVALRVLLLENTVPPPPDRSFSSMNRHRLLFLVFPLMAGWGSSAALRAGEPMQLATATSRSVPGSLEAASSRIPDEEAEKARRYLGYIKVRPEAEALHRAVKEGRTYTIDLLLKAGVSVDARDEKGRTPLMLAALNGATTLADHLVKKGAALDAVDPLGTTALMLAVENEDDRIARQLIAAGAALDLADQSGRRALHRAILQEHPEIEAALLNSGSKPIMPGESEAPLTLALRSGKRELIQPLLAHGAPPVDWQAETTALFWKAYAAQDDALQDLLQQSHAQPPVLAGSDQPLLAEAVLWRDPQLIGRLIEWGGDPETQLKIPASQRFIETTGQPDLKFYLEEEQGMNVLMLAAGLGCGEGVAALLKGGANPLARTDHYKMVALSFAGRTGTPECERLLLGLPVEPAHDEITIRISLKLQQATISQWGEIPIHTSISTGRDEFPTPLGRYVISDKHRVKVSSIYDVPMPFFMRLSGRDFGLHEGYVPGYAASHGCIRVPEEMAQKLFRMAKVGTYVTIDE